MHVRLNGWQTIGIVLSVLTIMGCDEVTVTTGDLSSSDVEKFFRGHKVDGYYAVAIKKRSPAGVIYPATVHGFPTNMSVCEDLIAPYNKDSSLSVLGGEYFCEELR